MANTILLALAPVFLLTGIEPVGPLTQPPKIAETSCSTVSPEA